MSSLALALDSKDYCIVLKFEHVSCHSHAISLISIARKKCLKKNEKPKIYIITIIKQ